MDISIYERSINDIKADANVSLVTSLFHILRWKCAVPAERFRRLIFPSRTTMLVLQLHNFRFETWERWRRKGHGAGHRLRLPPSRRELFIENILRGTLGFDLRADHGLYRASPHSDARAVWTLRHERVSVFTCGSLTGYKVHYSHRVICTSELVIRNSWKNIEKLYDRNKCFYNL